MERIPWVSALAAFWLRQTFWMIMLTLFAAQRAHGSQAPTLIVLTSLLNLSGIKKKKRTRRRGRRMRTNQAAAPPAAKRRRWLRWGEILSLIPEGTLWVFCSLGFCLSQEEDGKPRGFDRGLRPDRIIGATDSSGELMFLMKWWVWNEVGKLNPWGLCPLLSCAKSMGNQFHATEQSKISSHSWPYECESQLHGMPQYLPVVILIQCNSDNLWIVLLWFWISQCNPRVDFWFN